MKSILVTGPSGFLGYQVIKLLNKRGFKPRALLPQNTDHEAKDVTALKQLDIELVEGSVDDPSSLQAACEGIDTVFHLRFVIKFSPSEEDKAALEKVNVIGTRNLLDAATQAGVERVVVSSSALTVGLNRKPEPLDETADWEVHKFTLDYPLSRRKAELEALARSEDAGPTIVAINPSFTLGPDDYVGAPANSIVNRLAAGLRVTAPIGFGVLDIRDYAEGALRAAERGRHGTRYILSGANINIGILRNEVASVSGTPPPRLLIPLPRWLVSFILTAWGIVRRLRGKSPAVSRSLLELWGRNAWYDASRAGEELGWKARPLQDSIKDVLAAEAATEAAP